MFEKLNRIRVLRYMRITIASVIFLLCLTHGAKSQGNYRIHLGTAVPISKFGLYGVNDILSNPTLGVNIGGKYSYRFTGYSIGFFAGIDFLYNGISKEYKEEIGKWPDYLRTDPPKYHAYYNIPLSTGLSYDFRLNDNLFLSCNAGLTVNCLLISDLEFGIYTESSDPAYSFGGRVGVCLIIKDRVSVNLDYLGLGTHNVLSETITHPTFKEEWSRDLNIHMLTLSAGIVF